MSRWILAYLVAGVAWMIWTVFDDHRRGRPTIPPTLTESWKNHPEHHLTQIISGIVAHTVMVAVWPPFALARWINQRSNDARP